MKTAILILFTAFGFQSIAQEIVESESRIDFKIKNLLVNTVKGTFSGMTGEVTFMENDLKNSKFNVCVDASTVNTGIEKRDEHLRTEDFFHVEKYPKICFESNSITKTESGFKTEGKLTMHGVTKEVSIPFLNGENTLVGSFILNRKDYSVGEDVGSFTADDEVQVTITCKTAP